MIFPRGECRAGPRRGTCIYGPLSPISDCFDGDLSNLVLLDQGERSNTPVIVSECPEGVTLTLSVTPTLW